MPEISVIVPVYNTAGYLPQCLDSILGQTFQDLEVICVDAGSTDDSAQVLGRYAAADCRVKVFSQSNAKQGAARNRGLAQASGRYIMFVDSDDWLDDDALQLLYDKAVADDADIVLTGTRLYDRDGKAMQRDYCNYEGWNGWRDGIPEKYFCAAMAPVCCRLHKSRFIRDNRLKFIEKSFYEDNSWGCLVGLAARRVSFVRNVYCYRQHPASTTGIKDAKVFDWVKDLAYFNRFVRRHKISSPLTKSVYFWYLRNFRYYFGLLDHATQKMFYRRIVARLSELKLRKEDFAGGETVTPGEQKDLYRFWCYLKQKDFHRRRTVSIYCCGILLYRIYTMPDNSKSEHFLFGLIPFLTFRAKTKPGKTLPV